MGVASWAVAPAINTALARKANSVAGQAFSQGERCLDLAAGSRQA